MIVHSELVNLNILIPVFNRDIDLKNCLDSLTVAYHFYNDIELKVYVINDSPTVLDILQTDQFPYFFQIYNLGENVGKMAAIRSFFTNFNLSGHLVVLDSDDLVQFSFFKNIMEALNLSSSEFISFASNLSKYNNCSVYDTYINFRFNKYNMEDRLDLFPVEVFRDVILRQEIPQNILFPEFILYYSCYSNNKIFFFNKETIVKNYKDGGYSKAKWSWYKKSCDVFRLYYFLLSNAPEANISWRFKSFIKYVYFSAFSHYLKSIRFIRIHSKV